MILAIESPTFEDLDCRYIQISTNPHVAAEEIRELLVDTYRAGEHVDGPQRFYLRRINQDLMNRARSGGIMYEDVAGLKPLTNTSH